MIKAIIVDDENKSRKNLKVLLEEYCKDIIVVGIAGTIKEAIKFIDEQNPHVVFLDIQLSNESGFDLLAPVHKINFEVVFTTALSEHAIKTIMFSSIDYLLKPINIDDLKDTVKKLKDKVSTMSQMKSKLEILMHNLEQEDSYDYKLALPSSSGLVFMNSRDIIYCEGQSNYSTVYLANGKQYIVSKTIKEYEILLSGNSFFRINKSHLINMNEIMEYDLVDGRYVIMNNHKSLDISRRKNKSFLMKISSRIQVQVM